MGTITLETVETKQAELAQMIDALRVQSSGRTIQVAGITVSLVAGEHYAGAILNEDGSVAHHLVLLAGELVRIECPAKHEDELHASLENCMKRRDWWSADQFDGCHASVMGLRMPRVNAAALPTDKSA